MRTTVQRSYGEVAVAWARTRRTAATVAVLGLLVAMAAAEHGVGEIVQRPSVADGPFIESWPDTAVFEQLSGEPAMTIVPNPVVAGTATIVLAAAFAWIAIRNHKLRHAGASLMVLSVALLLVGGGLAPPLIGALLAVTWHAARRGSARDEPGPVGRRVRSWWRAALVVATVSYLGLFPGTVLLHWWYGVNSATLVTVLGLGAFGGLFVALTGAVAADRYQQRVRQQ